MKIRIVYQVNGKGETEYKPQRRILWWWRAWPHYSLFEVDGRQVFDTEEKAKEFLDERVDDYLARQTVERGIL